MEIMRVKVYSSLIWLLFFLFSSEADAASNRVNLSLKNSPKRVNISDLSWNALSFPVTTKVKNGQVSVEVTLEGNYTGKSGRLFYLTSGSSKPIDISVSGSPDRSFSIQVLLQGEKTQIELTAVLPSGVYAKDKYELSFPNYLKEVEGSKGGWKLDLKGGRVLGAYFANKNGGFGTTFLSWNPRYGNSNWSLQANLGVAPLRNGSLYFLGFDYSLLAAVRAYRQFWVEASFGKQLWTDFQSHSPAVGSNLVYQLERKGPFFIDQLILGYSAYLLPDNLTSEIKVGVGIRF
jgi:hypothetical protein